MKRIAKSSDTTIDGLFHTLIAAALREERAAGVADVVTAIERGPDHRRWSGGLEITDWISFAIVANPCNINITAHSYADQMSVGLLVGHGVLPQPRAFLERMAWELEVLDMALSPWRQSVDERTSG